VAWNGGTATCGIAYTPVTNSWTNLPPAPLARGDRSGAAIIWTGREVVMWSGWNTGGGGATVPGRGRVPPRHQHLNGASDRGWSS
jgi:hypothetical protein